MTERERVASEQRRVDRATMMQELQQAFGEVVQAATAGKFDNRVEATFPDAELNRLADQVNSLVETVRRGLAETGSVLASIADT
ncbi:MAG: methyl-accepting chemotaxis protein, partial [Anaerolineales bacterium]